MQESLGSRRRLSGPRGGLQVRAAAYGRIFLFRQKNSALGAHRWTAGRPVRPGVPVRREAERSLQEFTPEWRADRCRRRKSATGPALRSAGRQDEREARSPRRGLGPRRGCGQSSSRSYTGLGRPLLLPIQSWQRLRKARVLPAPLLMGKRGLEAEGPWGTSPGWGVASLAPERRR